MQKKKKKTVVSLNRQIWFCWHWLLLVIRRVRVVSLIIGCLFQAYNYRVLSWRVDDVRIINLGFYTYIRCTHTPTGRIKVQGQYDTSKYRCIHLYIHTHTLGMNYFTFTRDTSFTPNLRLREEWIARDDESRTNLVYAYREREGAKEMDSDTSTFSQLTSSLVKGRKWLLMMMTEYVYRKK